MTDVGPRISEAVIDPRNGEVHLVADTPHEQLADILLALRWRLDQLKQWEQIVNDELVRRHGARRAAQPVGAYEVDVKTSRGRDWDVTALDYVLKHLVDMGLLGAHEIEGIVILEKRVDGKKAVALLNDLDGEALQMVRDCFVWKKGRAKVEVTPSAVLEVDH